MPTTHYEITVRGLISPALADGFDGLSATRSGSDTVLRGEIGSELLLSVHTVKTHMRKLYAKLDVHTRAEAVQRGRALGLLAPGRRSG